jgi:hypothetical protein
VIGPTSFATARLVAGWREVAVVAEEPLVPFEDPHALTTSTTTPSTPTSGTDARALNPLTAAYCIRFPAGRRSARKRTGHAKRRTAYRALWVEVPRGTQLGLARVPSVSAHWGRLEEWAGMETFDFRRGAT